MPQIVLVAYVSRTLTFPDHGDSDDDDEGSPSSKLVDGGDEGDGEKDGDKEEVDIGQSFELQEQSF